MNREKLKKLNEIHKLIWVNEDKIIGKSWNNMVKDLSTLFSTDKGMEREMEKDDKRRSKDFITAIEKRL
ncbi:hypothetical protein Tco_0335149 [Tanacetum coccineum]